MRCTRHQRPVQLITCTRSPFLSVATITEKTLGLARTDAGASVIPGAADAAEAVRASKTPAMGRIFEKWRVMRVSVRPPAKRHLVGAHCLQRLWPIVSPARRFTRVAN